MSRKKPGFNWIKKAILLLSIVVILSSISYSGSAREISNERVEVELDSYQSLDLKGKKGGVLKIDVKVIEGDAVDVFVMNETNFYYYITDKDFEYLEKGSALNIKEKKWSFKAPEDGVYHVVLDNTDKGVAYPTSDIEVKIVISDVTKTPFIGVLETAFAFLIAGFLIFLTRAKSRRIQN